MGRKAETRTNGIRTLFDAGASQITLFQAIDAFLRAEEKDWSDKTEKWYRMRLEGLAEFLGSTRELSSIMEIDLMDWRTNLGEVRQLSAYTFHGHVRAVKRFFKWLYEIEILPTNLAEKLKLPKLPRQGRKGISESNLKAILEAARDNPRDYALFRFIESTGVRRGGAANLRLADIYVDDADPRLRRRATVREKGDKERTVIMSDEAVQALETWLEVRPDISDDHVFLGQSPGQPWHGLSDVGISEAIDRYKKRLGLKGPCSPHQWRHRWCRVNLQNGMPIGHVSQLAGHSDIKVTHDFYGQFSIDQLQESYDKHYNHTDE